METVTQTPSLIPSATKRLPPALSHSDVARVRAMYRAYDPSKLGTVDATLHKYRGRESELIAALVRRYGPEPEPPVAAYLSYEQRIRAVLEAYAPEKLRTAEALVDKFRGKEPALLESLVRRYGPEPDPRLPPWHAAVSLLPPPTHLSPPAFARHGDAPTGRGAVQRLRELDRRGALPAHVTTNPSQPDVYVVYPPAAAMYLGLCAAIVCFGFVLMAAGVAVQLPALWGAGIGIIGVWVPIFALQRHKTVTFDARRGVAVSRVTTGHPRTDWCAVEHEFDARYFTGDVYTTPLHNRGHHVGYQVHAVLHPCPLRPVSAKVGVDRISLREADNGDAVVRWREFLRAFSEQDEQGLTATVVPDDTVPAVCSTAVTVELPASVLAAPVVAPPRRDAPPSRNDRFDAALSLV